MPGFHDSHIHLIDAAKAAFDLQTSGVSVEQVQKDLKYYNAYPEYRYIEWSGELR